MVCGATQDAQVTVETSDKTWSSGGGNGNLLQYSCCENPVDSMKRRKDLTPEDDLPGSESVFMLLMKSKGQLLLASESEAAGPKRKLCSFVDMSCGES